MDAAVSTRLMVERAAVHEAMVSSLTSICPESWSFSSWGLNIRPAVKLKVNTSGDESLLLRWFSFTQWVQIVALIVV